MVLIPRTDRNSLSTSTKRFFRSGWQFLTLPGIKNAYPRPPTITRIHATGVGMGPIYTTAMCNRRALGKNDASRTPPRLSKTIFLAHESIPRKIPERFEKVVSSIWRGTENYLTIRETGAIVRFLLSYPICNSTINPLRGF
jgi:hypothetical protein